MTPLTIDVVIPALNEGPSLPSVLNELRKFDGNLVRRVVVADNGSKDDTAKAARDGGATVVSELEKGYGAACLKALDLLRKDPPDVVVFLDADFSDDPNDLPSIVAPIQEGKAEMVIGSRVLGRPDAGSLTPQQRVGNRFACVVLRRIYGARFTDLGPFRAIRWDALERLGMEDRNWGWTVEMQVKAARQKMSFVEVPVRYRKRIGVSKVSGTVLGTLNASRKILYVLARHSFSRSA